jgi:diguanylate cyclase (GGDEF)-like protein
MAALSDAAEGVATRARFFVDAGDKRTRRLSATLSVTGSGDGRAIIAVVRDETEVYLAERALTSLAATDALTGLANRRVFTEKLDQEWRRAAREDTPLSLLFIDVDRFKRFNDTYGHLQGDRCLRSIAEVIARAVTRAADLPARYGGEEFVLLLPNTDAHGARRVADHIRAAVEALAIPHVDGVGDGARVTVSLGVATQRPREPAQTTEGLLLAADRVLYEAKAAGRNRVCGGDAPPEPFDVEWRAAPAPAAPAREPGRAGRPV